MIGIIQDWLFIHLGINFDFKTLSDNNIFKDGFVFEVILKQYGLINHSICSLKPTNNNIQCKTNLYLLKPLFDMLKVNYNDGVILDIVEGKSSTIMKLLYELYICLENKQYLYFIKQVNYEKVHENLLATSNVKEFNENITRNNIVQSENVCFETPLLLNKDVINWYKKKYTYVQHNLSTKLKSLKNEMCPETLINVNKSINACSCTKYSDEELLKISLPDLNMHSDCNNQEKLLNYNDFIMLYKKKLQQKIKKKHLEKSFQNEILYNTCNKIQENQNKLCNNIFGEILLKQSYYEKQILNKLISSQKQTHIEKHNQTTANKNILNEQEDQLNNDFKLKEDFVELEALYKNEQKRILDLHKQLYREKQALKRKLNLLMCNDIVREIIDMSVYASEFKSKYGVDVPKNLWNNWMQLFVKGHPVHIPFENLIERESNMTQLEYDDIIETEKIQDEVLNENDVEEYLLTCGRWFFKDICLEEGTNSDNVISFIIYRLLLSKYSPPEIPSPANIPIFKSATVILDLENSSSLNKLKLLLSKRKIHVFDTETAIKESIYTFQRETASPTEENIKDKKKLNSKNKKKDKKTLEKLNLKDSINKSTKKEKGKKKGDRQVKKSHIMEEINNNFTDKETQTSITEEVKDNIPIRTAFGLIGEEVSKLLNDGKKVEDSLTTKVIIEYLKTLEDVNGWVLLNYPITVYQAYELELALTGKKLPLDDYIIIEECEPNIKENIGASSFMVMSKLYLPPEICEDDKKFITHFSQFIKIKYDDNKSLETGNTKTKNEMTKREENLSNYNGENIVKTTLHEDLLERVYLDQDIFQHYICDVTNLKHIKNLARIILNENGINAANSVELFGEEIIQKLMNVKTKSKKTKPKKLSAKKTKEKEQEFQTMDSLGSKPKISLDDVINNINGSEAITTIDTQLAKEQNDESKVNNPGESGWEYITLPIGNELSVLLANVWENIENCYLSFLKDIFFQNRIINLRLVPYSTYAKEEIEKVFNKPDIKQDVVNYFTKYYREIDDNLRYLPDVKSQLHCKVFEMQQTLWKISDNSKKEIESKRQQIVLENWVANELCLLVNNHLCLIQCESNRSFQTMKLINNYYLSMLYECPPATSDIQLLQPLTEMFSTNIFYKGKNMSLSIPEKKPSNRSSESGKFESSSRENIIVHSLINCCDSEDIFDTINEFILQAITKAAADIKNMVDKLCSQMKVEEHRLSSSKIKDIKDKDIQSKKSRTQSIITTKPRKRSKTKDSVETKTVVDENFEKQKLLFLEWHYALISEEKRFSTYLELINKKSNENIMEFYCYIESVFCQLYKNNLLKYNNNILNINKLCEFLHTAIEEEYPLFYSPILGKDGFFIDKTEIIKPNDKQHELIELTEKIHSCYFTIKQLNKLVHVFRIAGPYGVIRKQPFCYILQDLMLFNSEDNQPHLPVMWHLLSGSQLEDVLDIIFGAAYSIDWRDFIIYNLEIQFPSVADLLTLRKTFLLYDPTESETIHIDDYEKVIFWFEVDLPSNPTDGLKLLMMKKLLFEMFKVSENKTNYTALLIYFCKDYEPHNGLRKALSVSLGKYVIISMDELNEIIINDKETKENVHSLLNDIIHSIVLNRDGVLINEIFDSISKFDLNFETPHSKSSDSILPVSIDSMNSRVSQNEFVTSNEKEMDKQQEISFKYDVELNDTFKISRIPVTTVIGVLNSLFHSQDKTYDLRNIYLGCLEEEADLEGMIDGHALITLSCIQKLFNVTNKFKISSPCNILQQYLKVKY